MSAAFDGRSASCGTAKDQNSTSLVSHRIYLGGFHFNPTSGCQVSEHNMSKLVLMKSLVFISVKLKSSLKAKLLPRTKILLLLFLTVFIWVALILILLLAVRLVRTQYGKMGFDEKFAVN